jgi:hypothetical protein
MSVSYTLYMPRPLLKRKARKNVETSPSVVISSENNRQPEYGNVDPKDGNFSYADAEKLVEMLIEKSRKSKIGFFKQERPRRPIRIRRTLSDGCLLKDGIEAPTSTPDTLFLSRYPSTKSTTPTQYGGIEMGSNASNVSLVSTCSTAADMDTQLNLPPSQESNDSNETVRRANSEAKTIREKSKDLPGVPRSHSFSFGSNFMQAKRWGRNMLQEMKTPLRRYNIRQGKQPAFEVTYLRPVSTAGGEIPKRTLDFAFRRPSSSQQFQNMKLQGGTGPPKYLSEQTLNELDKLDREEAKIKKELARLEKEKQQVLKRAKAGDKEKQKKEKMSHEVKGGKSSNLVRAARKDYFPRLVVL